MLKKSSFMGIRFIAPAALALTGLSLSGCGSDPLGDATSCNMSVELDNLTASVSALSDASARFEADLMVACNKIATADGGEAGTDVGTACSAATVVIDAAFSGSAAAYIEVTPGYCSINAQAQFDCEAGCQIDGECDFSPGAIEARCEPGEFSVACEGSCEGSAYCEGSASASVTCEGSCQGSCEGSCTVEMNAGAVCDGVCNGTCEGTTGSGGECEGTCTGSCELTGSAAASCSGSCEGSCKGRCEMAAEASVECDAEVRCEGSCTGTASAPKCDAEVTPPSAECNLDADCQASCEGNASVDAECVAPTVTISAQAEISASLSAALEAQLPVILEIGANAEIMLKAAADVPDAFVSAANAALDFPGCIASYGASLVATAEASVDISVSVSASASASGEVAGSTS
jgi:hypothetical protein